MSGAPGIADRLREVQVGVRDDLDVSRHVFRGEASYILRDPISFQSHQLSPGDYEIMVAITGDSALGVVFERLVSRGVLELDDEEMFYQFVLDLGRLGIISLPLVDDAALYRRFEQRNKAKRRGQILGFLFMRIPIYNPDAFLTRTERFARPFFTRRFLFVWLGLMIAALYIAVSRWGELQAPLVSLLDLQNIPLLWGTLIVLKLLHEFGHSYACKTRGGHVPEMGVFLIAGTPCAYMDATAAWGFPRKRDRILVSLAGMYVESICAALALFVWASTPPGTLNTMAYQVVVLASVVTIGFNINPLMRFDGYYVLSDLLDMPNLRQRAMRQVLNVFDRYALGLKRQKLPYGWRMRAILLVFGISSALYKVTLVISICAMVAMKFFLVGAAMAVFYFTSTIWSSTSKMVKYLWLSEQTATVRHRAIVASLVPLLGIPLMLAFVPTPRIVEAAGVVRSEDETVIRAAAPGFVREVLYDNGSIVRSGQALVHLENVELEGLAAEAAAELQLSRLRAETGRGVDAGHVLREQERQTWYQGVLDNAVRDLEALDVRSDVAGSIVYQDVAGRVGQFVSKGDPVATIGSGPLIIKVLARAEDLADSRPHVGSPVECRTAADPDIVVPGTVLSVGETGTRAIGEESLTQMGGGEIVVDPNEGQAAEPYFEIHVAVDDGSALVLQHGMTVHVRFEDQPVTIGRFLYRRLNQFVNKMRTG